MVWQNEMVRVLRYLIDDINSSTYSDSRLEETIIVAAQLLIDDIDFDNTYTIDVDALTLSPDPTELSTKDNDFINLVSLKAACIVLGSEAKTLASQSYVIKDGPSSIDTTAAYKALRELHKQMCDDLASSIIQLKAGSSVGGQAIITPYTYEGFGPDYYRNFV